MFKKRVFCIIYSMRNNKKTVLKNGERIHFIGVGGISMSALAKFCRLKGYNVSGSDRSGRETLKELSRLGIKTFAGHDPENVVGATVTVYTSAINDDNPELVYATEHTRLYKRSELLGEIMRGYKTAVCVSGSHGKTTATAMIAHILLCADKAPTVFLGGEDSEFGNLLYGGNDYCVAEACEYKKNFLDLKPSVAVVLNVDNDHQDCFDGINDEIAAFDAFLSGSIAVINADDNGACRLFNSSTVTFGIKKRAVYTAKYIKEDGRGLYFTYYKYGVKEGRIRLNVKGYHNVYNALSALAASDVLGVPFGLAKRGLESFKGVKRRAETIGEIAGVKAVADYAHHPREITAALNALGGLCKDSLVVFQPHTYSRTEKLMGEFVDCLIPVRNLIIYKTYPAREKYSRKGSARALYTNLKKISSGVSYAKGRKELKRLIDGYEKKIRTVLFIGAGDIYDVAKKMLTKNAEIRVKKVAKKVK